MYNICKVHKASRKSRNNAMEILRIFLGKVSLCDFYIPKLFYVDEFACSFKKTTTTGRDKEIRYFMCSMKKFLMSNCSQVLMYEGLSGCGKSQILMEIEYLAQGESHR
jgi:hypothetical protein